jgi:hypothetical protein
MGESGAEISLLSQAILIRVSGRVGVTVRSRLRWLRTLMGGYA